MHIDVTGRKLLISMGCGQSFEVMVASLFMPHCRLHLPVAGFSTMTRKELIMPSVKKMSRRQIERGLRLYPPFLGAGIRVVRIADDFLTIEVKMRLRFWNKTGVGTHFGGSLYSMCDPFFMLMLIKTLGPNYLVWDKAASIRFKRPGT